jgi:hypothetical protein
MESNMVKNNKKLIKAILGILALLSIITSVAVILIYSNIPFCKPANLDQPKPVENIVTTSITPTETAISPTPNEVVFEKCNQRFVSEFLEFDCPANSEVAINPEHGFFEDMNIYGVTSLNIKTPRYTLGISIFQGGWGAYEYNPERPLELIYHPEGGEIETLTLSKAPKLYTFKNGMRAILTELEGKKQLFFTFSKTFSNEDSLYYFEASEMTVWHLSDFQFIKFAGDFTVNDPSIPQMIRFDIHEDMTEDLADTIVSDFQRLMDSYEFKILQ